MRIFFLACLLLGISVLATAQEPRPARFELDGVEMGVPIRIVLYAPKPEEANEAAQAALARIRQLNGVLSDYDPQSELRRLTRVAKPKMPVPVSDDLWHVLHRANELSRRSNGAFDVTVAPVVRLWRRARRQRELPSNMRLEAARRLVGYHLVRLHEASRSVELLAPNMRLDLGGIAKGYAVDQALATLREHGITRALVDAGGDIGLGDPPPGKRGWLIGVAPLERGGPPSQMLHLARMAIATSGDREQYVEIDGQRYSHLVDPRTGLGLTDHSSVTVIAPNCTAADSLASAVSVLGPEKGRKLIDATPGTAAFIVRAPEGSPEIHASRCWSKFSKSSP